MKQHSTEYPTALPNHYPQQPVLLRTPSPSAGIQRETLYLSFSESGNPTLETLSSVLSALGMKLSISAADSQEVS
jgi:hypothetical protein